MALELDMADVLGEDGNLALVRRAESLPAAVPAPTLPAIQDAAGALIAAERDGAAQSAFDLLTTEQQAVVQDQVAFCRAVWMLWRGGGRLTFDLAYTAVAARLAGGDFQALAKRGKFSKPVVRDHWLPKLLDAHGQPVWDVERLVPAYRTGGVKQSQTKALPVEWSRLFATLYLTRGVRNVRQVWEFACAECLRLGLVPREDLPKYHQAAYYAKTKIPQRLKDQYRVPKAEKASVGGYILRKWRRPGEIFMMDHHRLDILVRVPIPGTADAWCLQRPWVTAVRDAASGFILSVLLYVDQGPNHERVVECLYRALVAAGGVPPLFIVIDNGKDFLRQGMLTDLVLRAANPADSATDAIAAALGDMDIPEADGEVPVSVARCLNIQVRRAKPFKGRQKPVERDFRNVADDYAKLWPAHVYCGHSPETRPSESQREDRQFAREPHHYPSVQQAQDAIEAWLFRIHARPSNGRILRGKSPAEAWAGRPVLDRAPLSERQLQLACMIPQKRLVGIRPGPSGADVQYRKWWFHGATDADCLALAAHSQRAGAKFLIKTAFNVDTFEFMGSRIPERLWVFTPEGRYVAECEAELEFDALAASQIPEERDAFQAACRRIVVIRKARAELRAAATGGRTERRVGPREPLEFAGLAGVDAPPQLPPAADGSPRAAVSAPVVPGPGRGRARVVQDGGKAAEIALSATEEAEVAVFRRSVAAMGDGDGAEIEDGDVDLSGWSVTERGEDHGNDE